MADAIAIVADGIATGSIVLFIIFILFYYILSSEMLDRTSFHMQGRWYLPMFLGGWTVNPHAYFPLL